jgi:cbb3-type cytochrome oxidase maturation protein
MQSLVVLLPLSLLLLTTAVAAFLWAVNNNQFEDLERQGLLDISSTDDTHTKPPSDQLPGKPHRGTTP